MEKTYLNMGDGTTERHYFSTLSEYLSWSACLKSKGEEEETKQ